VNEHPLPKTKDQIVREVAEQSGLSQKDAGLALDAILETIQETLKSGGEITLTGFGKFHVAERGARQGVNPQTRERIQIGPSKVPRFSAGARLKRSLGLPGDSDEKL
jgi:DNA-binding protein HU-beta